MVNDAAGLLSSAYKGKVNVINVPGCPGKSIIYSDPGSGKTRMAIEAIARKGPDRKILVICSKKALNTWKREFPKWSNVDDTMLTIIEGQPTKRKKLWARDTQIYVTTYGIGFNDWNKLDLKGIHNFQILVSDECKVWRNKKTKSFKDWAPIVRSFFQMVILMDGTLGSRGPRDFWTFLNMLNPKLFSSYWRFVDTYHTVVDGPYGKDIQDVRNEEALAKVLGAYMVRINEDDISDQRPPLSRDFIPVEMNAEQKDLYDQLTGKSLNADGSDALDSFIAETKSGNVIAIPTVVARIAKLRQVLVCPKVFDEAYGYGTSIEHLVLEMEDDPHVVIFTPFTKAIPYICQAIQEAGHPMPYVLQGGTHSDVVGQTETAFNGAAGASRSLVCSIGFAESYELWSAKQVFFLGYDWSQLTNYQAEKRLHRLITPHPIYAWYYKYVGTVDEDILAVLLTKEQNMRVTFSHYIRALQASNN